jgi:hypothetical protein
MRRVVLLLIAVVAAVGAIGIPAADAHGGASHAATARVPEAPSHPLRLRERADARVTGAATPTTSPAPHPPYAKAHSRCPDDDGGPCTCQEERCTSRSLPQAIALPDVEGRPAPQVEQALPRIAPVPVVLEDRHGPCAVGSRDPPTFS